MQQASQIDEPDFAPLMDDMFFAPAATSRSIASSRRASRSSWRSCSAGRCGPGRDARRRARRDRLRDAGDRDHRCAHRAVRPRDQGAAQGLRHDRRLRRQRRHRHSAAGRCAPTTSTCAGSARCSTRTASIEETGLAAGVLNHPANGVAWLANKIAAVRRAAERRRRRARRLVHAPDDGGARRRLPRRLRAARRDRVPLRLRRSPPRRDVVPERGAESRRAARLHAK